MTSLMIKPLSSLLTRSPVASRQGLPAPFRPAVASVGAKPNLARESVSYYGAPVARAAIVAMAKKGGKGGGGDEKGGKGSDSGDLAKIEKDAKADAEDRMKKALDAVMGNFNTIRTGRANPAILDRIMVDQFGVPTPLKRLAGITVPEASTLLIAPFDAKGTLRDIEKAILESDIGINPSNDGEKIRLSIPPLTQERRKELTKSCAKFGEDGKVAVRNVRKDVLQKVAKVEFPKDTKKDLEDAIQKYTDVYVKKLEDMVKAKSEELLKM